MGGVSEKAPHGHWRNPRQSSMGFIPENQVRTRLPAGGRRIRTIGPQHERAGFCCGRRIAGPNGGSQKGCFLCGTDSSNPSPSSGESATNPARATPVSGARGRASRGGIYLAKTWRTSCVCYIIPLRLSTSPSDTASEAQQHFARLPGCQPVTSCRSRAADQIRSPTSNGRRLRPQRLRTDGNGRLALDSLSESLAAAARLLDQPARLINPSHRERPNWRAGLTQEG